MSFSDHAERKATFALLVISLIAFVALAWLQYFSFSVPAADFSIFDQMIPNTARGRFMFSAACGNCNHFGVHSTPILFLLYPFHRWIGHPLFFITLHAVILWSATIPLVLLCRLKLERPWHRVGVLVSFLGSPFLIKILDYQFHPEMFYVPLFLWFVYFVETKRWRSLWIVAALILSVKEDGAIYLSAAAGAAFVTRRLSLRQAAMLIAVSLAVFAVNVKSVIPANSQLNEYRIAGTSARFGKTVSESALGMLCEWNVVLLDLLRGAWLKNLFRFLFLPLSDPFFLIAILPYALIHSVADSGVMRGLAVYYSAPYLPWVFAGFVLALSRKWLPSRARDFAVVFAVVTSLPAWYPRHFPKVADVGARVSRFDELSREIDFRHSVCAQGVIFPHLGYAEHIDVLSDACIKSQFDYYVINPKLSFWPFSQQEIDGMIRALDENPSYERKAFGDFVLFSKRR